MSKVSISFIGSGNVATHFSLALKAKGYSLKGVFSPTKAHARQLAQMTGAEPWDIQQLQQSHSDVYIIATKDDAIAQMARQLRFPQSIVLHTSGSVPMEILREISSRCGVLYCPQTFVKEKELDCSKLPFCVEGSSPEVLQVVKGIALSISENVYEISSAQRLRIHLAAVLVNNFVNALNATAQKMLQEQNIPFEILSPLIQETARNSCENDLWKLQTGPAVRNDSKTISLHESILEKSPQLLQLYELMTDIIQHETH